MIIKEFLSVLECYLIDSFYYAEEEKHHLDLHKLDLQNTLDFDLIN